MGHFPGRDARWSSAVGVGTLVEHTVRTEVLQPLQVWLRLPQEVPLVVGDDQRDLAKRTAAADVHAERLE